MRTRKLKLLISTVFLFFIASSLFAVEEYISNIYKELDHIFIIKSEKDLGKILSTNNSDKYYYLIENYTEKKIRRLIVNNDYDFAMTAIVIVIENNLENENAVEMYSVIADAYEIQLQHEAEIEQKRQLELARVQMEKEKQREGVEKEYVSAVNTSSGKAVYVSGKETKLTSSNWKASFGLIDLSNLYDVGPSFNSFLYGISLDYRYEYTLENKMVVGTDITGAFQPLCITENENDQLLLGDVELFGKFATPKISKDLFFRVGFGAIIAGVPSIAVNATNVANTLYTPILGVKMERVQLGTCKLDIGADWYAGHLFTPGIDLALGANANLEFPFAEMEKLKLNLNIGIQDKFFMKNSGIENRASLILAVGAENVIR